MPPARRHIAAATTELHDAGAEIAIAACTGIPLIADEAQQILPLNDSTAALADHALAVLMPNLHQSGA